MSRTEELSNALIKDVTSHMQGNECVLNWHWAESVPCVYVYKSRFDTPFDPDQINEKDMKLYTREEYKVHRGYREYIDGYGRYTYRIFPCQLQNGRPVMLIPDGEDHIIHVSSGKAKIYYSFKKGKKWFSQHQTLQIRIFSEILIPKEALCYVKKEGSPPANKDDGTQYAFIRDLEPGENVMPEIEIKKKDYIRLFFTDGKKYGQSYELIPE
ncbi:beta-mannanase [Brevibacillus laterosporus]|uniref:beta-mannanase n=1 Tax=Brevibacillus laterosporus TaxID=1465 RepID=UPI0018CF217F|nr:beta-mannanase [Brevibacillus laterosporus]MBG9796746.1 beta-mannanase [Brevibacillus laterosporus]MCR8936619.1 beta-mannanase [Brevibacillus laterosporus]MCZ0839258.1 beta-mannanase [Brevibacillus laterosporus]MCZ0844122.1 beta-mannanase [Brevibacillus laterosporus]MED1910925.1 beta-mannanase [Brevibacillus laterosporus]